MGYNWKTWNRAFGKEESHVHDMSDPNGVRVHSVSKQIEDERPPRYNELSFWTTIWRSKLVKWDIALWYDNNNIIHVCICVCIKIKLIPELIFQIFAERLIIIPIKAAFPATNMLGRSPQCFCEQIRKCINQPQLKKGKPRKAGMTPVVVEPQWRSWCLQVLWHWEEENREGICVNTQLYYKTKKIARNKSIWYF